MEVNEPIWIRITSIILFILPAALFITTRAADKGYATNLGIASLIACFALFLLLKTDHYIFRSGIRKDIRITLTDAYGWTKLKPLHFSMRK